MLSFFDGNQVVDPIDSPIQPFFVFCAIWYVEGIAVKPGKGYLPRTSRIGGEKRYHDGIINPRFPVTGLALEVFESQVSGLLK